MDRYQLTVTEDQGDHVLWINVLGMALPDLPKLALGLAVIALSLASVPVLRQVNRSIPVL